MNARNRVFMILGLLTLGSLVWYLLTARTSGDLKLIGTVDANEVLVSAKIPGRIQTLNVDEGQAVKAGDLIAVVESDDLAAAQKAAEANVQSDQSKLAETVETQRQNEGEVSSATVNAEAQVKASAGGAGAGPGESRTSEGRHNAHGRSCQAGNCERSGQGRSRDAA